MKNSPNYTGLGIGIGALAGIGLFGCALSAGIIATPLLVPAGLGIIAGSMLAGGVIGHLASSPSNSPLTKPRKKQVIGNLGGGRNCYGNRHN